MKKSILYILSINFLTVPLALSKSKSPAEITREELLANLNPNPQEFLKNHQLERQGTFDKATFDVSLNCRAIKSLIGNNNIGFNSTVVLTEDNNITSDTRLFKTHDFRLHNTKDGNYLQNNSMIPSESVVVTNSGDFGLKPKSGESLKVMGKIDVNELFQNAITQCDKRGPEHSTIKLSFELDSDRYEYITYKYLPKEDECIRKQNGADGVRDAFDMTVIKDQKLPALAVVANLRKENCTSEKIKEQRDKEISYALEGMYYSVIFNPIDTMVSTYIIAEGAVTGRDGTLIGLDLKHYHEGNKKTFKSKVARVNLIMDILRFHLGLITPLEFVENLMPNGSTTKLRD